MSIPRLVFWITLLSIFAMASRVSMDTDTWWHLRAGEWIFNHRAILQHDEFSYTRFGDAWNYPGWIVQVPMFLIFKSLGPGGMNIWTAGMVAAAFAFSWHTLRGGYFLKAFLLILAAAASSVFWSARPHLVSFLLASATLYILEKSTANQNKVDRRYLFWLPAIMLLWVNSHGGFVVGFMLWGIYWVAQQFSWISNKTAREKYAMIFKHPGTFFSETEYWLTLAGLLMVAAACINPSGFQMLNYPFQTLGIGALRDYIQEWQSPDFHSLSVQPFLWLLFTGFAAVGLSRRVISLADFMLFSIFGILGFMAGRNIALFALTAPLVISRHLDPVLTDFAPRIFSASISEVNPRSGMQRINLAVFSLVALAAIAKAALVFPADRNMAEFQKYLPVKAVAAIHQESLNGPLFNSYNWGGYLLWSAPELPVFIDGRTDLYNDEIIQQWLDVVQVKNGWESILEDYRVNLVINETGSDLSKSLRLSSQWSQVYEDPVAAVFAREIPLE